MLSTVVLEKTLESPLDCYEIKPVHLKGNQPWIFTGRTDAEAETLILWPPDAKSRLFGKDSDAVKDWGQKDKGVQRMRWLDNISDSIDMSLSKLLGDKWWTGKPSVLQSMGSERVGHDLATEQQNLNFCNLILAFKNFETYRHCQKVELTQTFLKLLRSKL